MKRYNILQIISYNRSWIIKITSINLLNTTKPLILDSTDLTDLFAFE